MSETWEELNGISRYIQKKVKMFAERAIDIDELDGKIAEYVRELSKDGEPIFLVESGKVVGVIISPKDDTNLSILAESVENMLIAEGVKNGAKSYNSEENNYQSLVGD